MCRNILPLYNIAPPATPEDIQAAALQFVRKVSGYHKPSRLNRAVLDQAVEEIAAATQKLLEKLVARSPARD